MLLSFATIVIPPASVRATDVLQICNNVPAGTPPPSACKDRQNNTGNANPLVGPDGIITTYTRILALVIGFASIIMIIVSGFKFVMSQGDPNNVTNARNSILYAVIGLGVAAFAQLIVTFVISKL